MPAHRLFVSLAAQVDVTGRGVLGGDLEDLERFPPGASARVVESEADGERACLKAALYAPLYLVKFARGGFAEGGVGDG